VVLVASLIRTPDPVTVVSFLLLLQFDSNFGLFCDKGFENLSKLLDVIFKNE
jgi:hypothetical protein